MRYLLLFAIFVAIILGALLEISKARDLDELIDRKPNSLTTHYYPEHRVFCATRLNAISCVKL